LGAEIFFYRLLKGASILNTSLVLFGIFVFLAVFNAGAMTTLQIQHYGIYPFVGRESFKEYIRANNKAATIPAILPAMLLRLVSILLLFFRPTFMTFGEAASSLALNLISLASTLKWQRKLQYEMASTGYDEAKVALLNSTNWIRTITFIAQAVFAMTIVVRALAH
jgi:hypothetical protein